jgi:phosphoribosylaminoimidazole-succinocarboxamide synthase
MVIRGYLAGHAWREYKIGKRVICGVSMPDGMRENDPFPEPILTPTIKASEGHDEDISREDIIASGLVNESDYLILVDTKYEFGKFGQEVMLMDEIHTPDSSRYFYADTYEQIQEGNQQQRQLSKEFVRQWLIENGFQGLEGQIAPVFSDEFINLVSQRYIELFEKITAQKFVPQDYSQAQKRVEENMHNALKELQTA